MPETMSYQDTLKHAREIEQGWETPPGKLAVLASFTANFLEPFLVSQADQHGLALKPWFGPFNQFEQVVLDPSSPLFDETTTAIWVSLRLEDVDRHLVTDFPTLNHEEKQARLGQVVSRLADIIRAIRKQSVVPVLVSNLTVMDQEGVSRFDASDPDGLTTHLAVANKQLAKMVSEEKDVTLFDFGGCVAEVGRQQWRDDRMWYMARTPFSQVAQQLLASRLVQTLAALLHPSAKVIVVDLDNTLWGGVLGEDGPGGIKLGDDYPGSIYKDVQALLLGLKRKGFLLAIASKNNEDIVLEVLRDHPEMLLREDDFTAILANWDPKPVNVRQLAETLNLGLDSFVFIDDNPVERAAMRSELPMVQVVELPKDPIGYREAILALPSLDKPRVLSEDLAKTAMYQQEVKRKTFQQTSGDGLEDFLAGLEMRAEVGLLNETTAERVHQLIGKTNQFNLTTRRHTLQQVQEFAQSKSSAVAWLRLRDRFGDMGLVVVGIVKLVDQGIAEIDTFLMSCRVMGRKVEDAFLAYLVEQAKHLGAKQVRGIFVQTAKNKPVESFYRERGFVEESRPSEATVTYLCDIDSTSISWPPTIERLDHT